MSAAARPPTAGAPSWSVAALHLAVLWSFAFVQPLFDLLGHEASFFVARGNTAGDILAFAFALVIVAPAIMVAAEALVGLVARGARRRLHLGFVALLAGAFVLELLKRPFPAGSAVLLPAAAAAGLAFAVAYARAAGVRSFLTVLGPAPLIFLVLFLVVSPVSQLLRPEPTVHAATGPPAETPVVLAIFDELPAISLMRDGRRIDAERYPGFARLARESTWYRNATTVSDGTTRAVPAILSGLRPEDGTRLPTSRTYPRSLFTLLGPRWEQHVLEAVTDLCPAAICPQGTRDSAGQRMRSLASDLGVVSGHLLLPEDLAGSLPAIDRGWADFAGIERGLRRGLGGEPARERPRGDWWARQVEQAERSIAAVRAQRARPPLHVIHFVAPHLPWRYLPAGERYPEPRPMIPGLIPQKGWGDNRYLVRQGLQRHLLQVGFTDRLLGALIRRLKRARLWDRALVVVVADHGASFRPGEPRRPVTAANFADVAGVPLFVKRPGQRAGRVDERPVRTIDVLPTIAETVGRGHGWSFDGAPLDRLPREPASLRVNNQNEDRDVTLTVSAFLRARDAQLAQQLRLFPPGRDSLYRLGPNPHLIGRPVSALAHAPSEGRGAVDRAGAYRRVDRRTGVVPAFVTGRLHPREPDGLSLAVAVDGRIRAVATSWRQDGQTRFSAIVPASSLPAGAHSVEVFAVGGGDELRPVARAAR